MIYVVTKQQPQFTRADTKYISVEDSISILKECKRLQFDIETTGLDPYLADTIMVQFGNDSLDFQMVIDTTTVDIQHYKEILESTFLIGHNLKFDLQFMYRHNIIPRKIYDTMIAEQFIFLGYEVEHVRKTLDAVVSKYTDGNLDKSIRTTLAKLGLSETAIEYARNDVRYLEKVMAKQLEIVDSRNARLGLKIECYFVPACAYLEYCGIKLDETKWKEKMRKDQENLVGSKRDLDNYVINHPKLKKYRLYQPASLFEDIEEGIICSVNWASSKEVIPVVKSLGFNTNIQDKKTGKDKDSVMEKHLQSQKGIDDTFLKLYFDWSGYNKVVSSFGQGHLDSIHTVTGRLHTQYRSIGTSTGRMSSGKGENKELAQVKKVARCANPNMQQLPHDEETRACFVAEKGNLFCSSDYASQESRIGAMVYNEKSFIDEYLYGSGDMHSVFTKKAYPEILKDVDVKDIKKKYKDLRDKGKSYGFSILFGSDGTATAKQLGLDVEETREKVKVILEGLPGLNRFKKINGKFVKQNGYVLINKQTGHRIYWEDWEGGGR